MEILPLKKQQEIKDNWLKHRLDNILPKLMEREGIDMWVILAREYNEDPVYLTLIPYLQRTASRLSGLVFFLDDQKQLECLSLGRKNPNLEKYYKGVWNSNKENQWQCLSRIIAERRPKKIGINTSKSFALADGLSNSLYNELLHAIDKEYQERLVSAEKLCVGWLETRSLPELEMYPNINAIAISIIEEAFSKKVITPGKTTTTDVEWWIMQKINDLGLKAWFSPTIDLQRRGVKENRIFNTTIEYGDILHCDVGIEYLGLCTDTQRIAYVLHPEEEGIPVGIDSALKTCNRFQDIVADNYIENRTGNEVFAASMKKADSVGIKAMLYTHPIGFHGHAIGPIIGLWDKQEPIPIRGDYPLHYNTCYALELNTSSIVPEWDNQEVTIFLEETVSFTKEGLHYMKNRQSEFILVQ